MRRHRNKSRRQNKYVSLEAGELFVSQIASRRPIKNAALQNEMKSALASLAHAAASVVVTLELRGLTMASLQAVKNLRRQ
ncbi:unnamed protein product, partial [Iphiclides podalirius]